MNLLKELIFPKFCLGCHLPGVYLCHSCSQKLIPIKKDFCFYCGKPSYNGLTHEKCLKKYGVNGVISFFYYNNFLKKIIKEIKYRGAIEVWKEFIQAIPTPYFKKLSIFKSFSNTLHLQSLPLHENKLKKRGFNQATIITDFFNQLLNLPIINSLIRIKDTQNQAQIKKKKTRYHNVLNAFKVINKNDVINKNIIIVDDVITTGYTLSEAAKTLKKAGALKVYCLSLARS